MENTDKFDRVKYRNCIEMIYHIEKMLLENFKSENKLLDYVDEEKYRNGLKRWRKSLNYQKYLAKKEGVKL